MASFTSTRTSSGSPSRPSRVNCSSNSTGKVHLAYLLLQKELYTSDNSVVCTNNNSMAVSIEIHMHGNDICVLQEEREASGLAKA